jgi:hypothetical protein
MSIFLQLTLVGEDVGNTFSLFSNADNYTTAFSTGVSKSSLLTGYTTSAPTGTTVVRVQSTSGVCDNYVTIVLIEPTTTTTTSSTSTTTTSTTSTSTTTTTTTAAPVTYYELAGCLPENYAFTAIAPTLGVGQQYILPGITPIFYTYTGFSESLHSAPAYYNASIQRGSVIGCP